MSGARACLGDTPRIRASLLDRTLAVARLACRSTRRACSKRRSRERVRRGPAHAYLCRARARLV